MASILLIQSDPAASARWVELLDTDHCLAVCGAVSSLQHAREAIERRLPDLLLGDLRLPDGLLVNLVRGLRPGRSHVAVIAASLRDPRLLHALRHGADAYLTADASAAERLSLVRQVLAGESPMAPELARSVMAVLDAPSTRPVPLGAATATQLPLAERALLARTAAGYLPEEAARALRITTRQVGRLARSVYRHLHAGTRMSACA